ncbi:MAG TPA: DedA family protein [Gaiellaceae bacterium]|nr:DedA family protein [Gaiellaceae bacterium]
MFDWLTEFVSGNWWTYGIVFGISGLDSFFPVVPSETVVITAGALAAHGSLLIWLVVPAAALGAFAGDQITYGLGHWLGEPVAAFIFRGEKGQDRLERAEHAVKRHGAMFVVAGRFIPGGRTASCFAAGTLEFPYRRFVAADGIAAVVWGVYASLIGYLGGTAFAHSLWKSLVLAFAVAIVVAGLLEVYRRVQERRGRDILNQPLDD